MSDIRFTALCALVACFLAASVILRIKGRNGDGWAFMAFVFSLFVAWRI